MKIAALFVAELWRENDDPRKVRMAKHMIEAANCGTVEKSSESCFHSDEADTVNTKSLK